MMRVIASLLVIIVIGSQNKLCRANNQCPNNSTLRIKRDDDSCAPGGIPDNICSSCILHNIYYCYLMQPGECCNLKC